MSGLSFIKMSQGAGGEAMQELIEKYFLKALGGSEAEVPLNALDDSAVIDDIVFTTDSHTVKPLFFPGGDIGTLSVAGTVNDVAVLGAKPIALSLGLVIEEGFPLEDLEKIMKSVGEASASAEVPILTGDTKVVERGSIDRLFTNTSGIGKRTEVLEKNIGTIKQYRPFEGRWLLDSNLRDGDKIIISGSMGDHGIALLSFREGYEFEGDLKSDVCPLNKMIEKALEVGGIVSMKDPTRGGLANTLNEWSRKSKVGLLIKEEEIPFNQSVLSACGMLGLDPLEIGNEGKVVIGVVKEMAEDVLETLRGTREGKDARIIGHATKELDDVLMETEIGGKRIVEAPIGDPIPRIC